MLKDKFCLPAAHLALLLIAFLSSADIVQVDRPGWKHKEVDWRMTGGARIKAVSYPTDNPPLTLNEHRRRQSKVRIKKITPSTAAALSIPTTEAVFAAVIDSPPIDGFVPWVVVSVTDERGGLWDITAVPVANVVGDHLTNNPESHYAIGIYDTGASTHLVSYDAAVWTGIDPNLVTQQPVTLLGATGTATGYATQPLGIFIAGLDILEPNGLLLDDSVMLGETNVSIIAGDPIESPNVPTAIGIPLGVHCSAAFCNNKQLSVTIDGNDFNSPYIEFYSLSDLSVPSYNNLIDLELHPSDAAAVQYLPCDLLGVCGDDPQGSPAIPSTIWGMLSNQSLYFLPWVHLADGNDSITFIPEFMFDTGAQVTVISRTMASGLHLDTNSPEFPVEIQDVTGEVTIAPGFYLDSLQIPADGLWLEYTNVPVIVLNVQSPEGGYLSGIIGMNLFVDLNFVVKGGGMSGQGYSPTLEFEPVSRITGDIAGDCYQCQVDYWDLAAFTAAWLANFNPRTENWNPNADMAPLSDPDGKIDFPDFTVLAEHWQENLP